MLIGVSEKSQFPVQSTVEHISLTTLPLQEDEINLATAWQGYAPQSSITLLYPSVSLRAV